MALARERIDSLEQLSDKVYDVINLEVDSETVARQILRLGILTVAQVLESSYGMRTAGDSYHALLVRELQNNGLPASHAVYESFPGYKNIVTALPQMHSPEADPLLIELANTYADIERLTVSKTGLPETDGSHVIHLSSLALPYAAEHYPHLDQSKIALYCLVHDILEAYAGDVPSLGASKEVMAKKDKAEAEALLTLELNFGTKYPKLIEVTKSYEHLRDEEARYVKTFDKLDPGFTHIYSNGGVLVNALGFTSEEEFYEKVDETTQRMRPYSGDYIMVMDDRSELTDRIARNTIWPNR